MTGASKAMSTTLVTRPQLFAVLIFSTALTHALIFQAKPTLAANGAPVSSAQSSGETTSSSQPLWTYQPKPSLFSSSINGQSGNNYMAHQMQPNSLFDSLSSLGQRQGSISTSPLLSILPIILIAAGGMMLILPLLTMMLASPFGSGFGALGGNGFGYPQVANLNKRRSVSNSFIESLLSSSTNKPLFDIVDHISTSIEELSKKNKLSKSSNENQTSDKQTNKK